MAKNYAEIRQARAELREYNKTLPKQRTISGRSIFGILGVVVPFVLVIVIAHTFMDNDYSFSFLDLLEELQGIPSFDVSLFEHVLNAFTIVEDWGAFNGLRDFLNLFGRLFGVLQFIGLMLFNALSYCLSFLRLVFGI